jgi:hypothetical protein
VQVRAAEADAPGMRVRVPVESSEAFRRAAERLSVRALPVGDCLELVHPTGRTGPHEDTELAFFVRAYSADGRTRVEFVARPARLNLT